MAHLAIESLSVRLSDDGNWANPEDLDWPSSAIYLRRKCQIAAAANAGA